MKKILIVDDEPHVIKVLSLFLKNNNFIIDSANNGLQALEKLKETDPDIIITDIQMPKMTGQDLCNEINANHPKPGRKIIVMTSRTDTDLRTWAKQHDNIIFMEKPLSPRSLVEIIREFYPADNASKEAVA